MDIAGTRVTHVGRIAIENGCFDHRTNVLDWIDQLSGRLVWRIYNWPDHQFHGLQTGDDLLGRSGCVVLVGDHVLRDSQLVNFCTFHIGLVWRWHSIVESAFCG